MIAGAGTAAGFGVVVALVSGAAAVASSADGFGAALALALGTTTGIGCAAGCEATGAASTAGVLCGADGVAGALTFAAAVALA
jgi:hypothetical protein